MEMSKFKTIISANPSTQNSQAGPTMKCHRCFCLAYVLEISGDEILFGIIQTALLPFPSFLLRLSLQLPNPHSTSPHLLIPSRIGASLVAAGTVKVLVIPS